MPKFCDRLRYLRNEKGLSQMELSKILNISKSSVNMYERGEREPGLKMLELIADTFNVDLDYLMGKSDCPNKTNSFLSSIPLPPNALPLPRMKEWKVLGGTACGTPLYKALDNETVLAPADIDADYVFRCVGDSMINARIFDGDIVFVKAGITVEDGQIAVVRIGEEYTLKRIYHGPDYLELRSENPMYKPIIVRGEQENTEIVGLAVKFLSNVI